MAPEMILLNNEKGYGYGIDIWSLGVIFYLLLTNSHPLQYLSDYTEKSELKSTIMDLLNGPDVQNLIHFDVDELKNVNSDILYILKMMLKIDPNERISAGQINEVQNYLREQYEEYTTVSLAKHNNFDSTSQNTKGGILALKSLGSGLDINVIKKIILETFSDIIISQGETEELSTLFNSLELSQNASIDQDNVDLFYSVYIENH